MPSPDRSARDGRIAIGATLVALLPMIWSIAAVVGRHYVPLGDYAIIDIRIRDAASGHLPLLGMYSRYGWYHPGPALFWLVAPLSFVTDKQAWATLVGCVILQGVAVVASARIAWQHGRLALVLAVLAVQTLSFVGLKYFDAFLVPWNPLVAFPFLCLFLLLAWSVGLGEVRRLPWAVAVGSFLVQLHLGYAILVAGGLAWALGLGFGARAARHEPIVHWRRYLTVSGVVLLVIWSPALVEQFRSHGGNLSSVIKFSFGGSTEKTFDLAQGRAAPAGFSVALRVFAAEFHWLPAWLGGRSPAALHLPQTATPVALGYIAVPVFLLLAALLLALRSGSRPVLHAVGLTILVTALAIVSLAGFRGELTDFAFYWRISIAVIVVGVAIAAVVTTRELWQHRTIRIATMGALSLAILLGSLALTDTTARGDKALTSASGQAQTITKKLSPLIPHNNGVILVAPEDALGVQLAVFDELQRRGKHVGLSPLLAQRYFEGDHGPHGRTDAYWALVVGTEISQFSHFPGAHLIATISPLSASDEIRAQQLEDTLMSQLEAAHRSDLIPYLESPFAAKRLENVKGVDQALARTLAALMAKKPARRSRFAVFSFPATEAPLYYAS